MVIAEASESDVPEIINLLKVSLGEALMPKSLELWNWKHELNPFGKSYVFIAREQGQLIGVRALMRWDWRFRGGLVRSVRAVDTATHPDHQGKGVFTGLTSTAVEQCRKDGIEFIFNTPNHASLPGYLKLGWTRIGRMPITTTIATQGFFGSREFPREDYEIGPRLMAFSLRTSRGDDDGPHPHPMVTRHTIDSLRWRYLGNPSLKYFAIADASSPDQFLVVFRLKQHKNFRELRICDVFLKDEDQGKLIARSLRQVSIQAGAAVITVSNAALHLFPSVRWHAGPLIICRPLRGEENTVQNISFSNWHPSIGDMEVF